MDEISDWIEVKPRRFGTSRTCTTSDNEKNRSIETSTVRDPSAYEAEETIGKVQIGRQAWKKKKLEWSARKRRERESRVANRRNQQDTPTNAND